MTLRVPLLLLALSLAACGGDSDGQDEPIVFDPGSGSEEAPEEAEPAEEPSEPDTESGLVIGDDTCETDADCVPAGCCHPSACVGAASAPDCSDTMCTEDCQFGTLDCGGSCLCHEGRCAAQLSQAPDIGR